MTKVILSSIISKDNKDAGPKAKNDIEEFLTEKGYEKINLEISRNKLAKLMFSFYGINKLFKGKDYEEIVFQYPIYSIFLTQRFIKAIRKYTKAKLIFVIHDVEAIRGYLDDQKFYKNELDIFNSTDGLIVHNEKMQKWLLDNGVKVPMVQLGIFDYINPNPIVKSTKFDRSLCFAGNLIHEKAGFMDKLTWKHTKLVAFGPNPSEKYPQCVNYQGVYPSEELPAHMNENFGLIWDGQSVDACTGTYGEYSKYNAPHKTSLYLSSGMPVIVWEQAAVAGFVEKFQVGITVNSLTELDNILADMTDDDYAKLKSNAEKISKKVRSGNFIYQAMQEMESILG